jgi:GNAT superfamily N-acetyltransferase
MQVVVFLKSRGDMPDKYQITLFEQPDPAAVQQVWDGLAAYNLNFTQPDEHRRLDLFLRDENQALVGGLLGGTYWGWLHVDILWLAEAVRGLGYGTLLMKSAEEEALHRGCRHAHLDTHDFQALGFYQKLGYSVYCVLDDLPPGHKRYSVKKDL